MTNHKLIDILNFSVEYLQKSGLDHARLVAEKILANSLGLKRLDIYLNYDRPLVDAEREKIKGYLKKAKDRMPLQYIFGEEYFYGRRFFVNENVLIPRPDTETLVEKALNLLENIESPKILDIGTGSGTIAISLGKERTDSMILGIDISEKALEIAEKNKVELDAKNVKFMKSNIFSNVKYREFHLIVSNPPYISLEEYKTLMPEVKDYEPKNALVAEDNGLYFYTEISGKAKEYLVNGGILCFEVGYQQSGSVKDIMEKAGFVNIEITEDLNGIERVVSGEKNV